jgi:hypothetical protein
MKPAGSATAGSATYSMQRIQWQAVDPMAFSSSNITAALPAVFMCVIQWHSQVAASLEQRTVHCAIGKHNMAESNDADRIHGTGTEHRTIHCTIGRRSVGANARMWVKRVPSWGGWIVCLRVGAGCT